MATWPILWISLTNELKPSGPFGVICVEILLHRMTMRRGHRTVYARVCRQRRILNSPFADSHAAPLSRLGSRSTFEKQAVFEKGMSSGCTHAVKKKVAIEILSELPIELATIYTCKPVV